jgi:hypothetical protein
MGGLYGEDSDADDDANAPSEEEVDEITEGGKQAPNGDETLEQFLSTTFGEEAPRPSSIEGTAVDPEDPTTLPSLGWIQANFKTKSAAIRFLVSRDFKVAEIATLLGVKYQHVRNVKVTELKRGPNEDWNLERRRLSESVDKKLKEKSK